MINKISIKFISWFILLQNKVARSAFLEYVSLRDKSEALSASVAKNCGYKDGYIKGRLDAIKEVKNKK